MADTLTDSHKEQPQKSNVLDRIHALTYIHLCEFIGLKECNSAVNFISNICSIQFD